jgi:anti-sigma factor RsiW
MSQKNSTDIEPLVARDATYYRAPDSLRRRVRQSLAAESRETSRPALARWGGMAAAFTLVGLVSWNAALYHARGEEGDRLVGEVAGAHVRSLMVEGRLNDVTSTDQHTVKPWFQGRLDFAPAVADFSAAGFTLAGGRLDYLNGRPVAAVTYDHRLHKVNVFEWPAAGESAPELVTRHGYSFAHWKHGGLQYWVASDAAGADLLQFAKLLSAS